jgi:hypothetical protein
VTARSNGSGCTNAGRTSGCYVAGRSCRAIRPLEGSPPRTCDPSSRRRATSPAPAVLPLSTRVPCSLGVAAKESSPTLSQSFAMPIDWLEIRRRRRNVHEIVGRAEKARSPPMPRFPPVAWIIALCETGRGRYRRGPLDLRNPRRDSVWDCTRRRCSVIHASASALVLNVLTLVG